MDERQLQAMMMSARGGQQVMIPSPSQESAMREAEQKQIRLFAVQMAVQAGVVDGGEGIIKTAAIIATWVNGGTGDAA